MESKTLLIVDNRATSIQSPSISLWVRRQIRGLNPWLQQHTGKQNFSRNTNMRLLWQCCGCGILCNKGWTLFVRRLCVLFKNQDQFDNHYNITVENYQNENSIFYKHVTTYKNLDIVSIRKLFITLDIKVVDIKWIRTSENYSKACNLIFQEQKLKNLVQKKKKIMKNNPCLYYHHHILLSFLPYK